MVFQPRSTRSPCFDLHFRFSTHRKAEVWGFLDVLFMGKLGFELFCWALVFEGHEKLSLGIEVIRCHGFHGDLFKKWKLEAETHASDSLIVLVVGCRLRGWSPTILFLPLFSSFTPNNSLQPPSSSSFFFFFFPQQKDKEVKIHDKATSLLQMNEKYSRRFCKHVGRGRRYWTRRREMASEQDNLDRRRMEGVERLDSVS